MTFLLTSGGFWEDSKEARRSLFDYFRARAFQINKAQKDENFFENAELVRNPNFQGVKFSRLKTPVCEVACEVATTMGTLRGLTVIRLCKDLSPC